MVSYNHERWIRQAIESVLSQTFTDLEVVVGEDCSPDGTLAIAREVAGEDSRVRVLDTPENLGGRRNFVRTFRATRGEFVNQLDGDDYFTDPDKLRLQVEMLDAHPELSGCFAGSQKVREDGEPMGEPTLLGADRDRYSVLDFARYCMTDSASMIFRRQLWADGFPDWFWAAPQGDWPIHMINAEWGDLGYIDRVVSAYRIHGSGVWNCKSEAEKVTCNLECQRHFLANLKPETVAAIRPVITKHLYGDVKRLMCAGHLESARIVMDWIKEHGASNVPLLKVLRARARLGLATWRAR